MERQGQIPQIKRTSSLFATLDVAWSSENEPDDHILVRVYLLAPLLVSLCHGSALVYGVKLNGSVRADMRLLVTLNFET